MTRKAFLGGFVAGAELAGCKSPCWFGEAPRLKFGVISDIHVTTPESAADFRRALVCFRDRGADAVLIAGDFSDWGFRSGLKAVADACVCSGCAGCVPGGGVCVARVEKGGVRWCGGCGRWRISV